MKSKIDYELDTNDTPAVMKSTPIGLPFVQIILKLLLEFYIKPIFLFIYPHRTIRQILPSTKDPIHYFNRTGAVYQILCSILIIFILVKQVDVLILD